MKLPLNCTVNYYGDFLTETEANQLYNSLIDQYKIDKARLVIYAGDRVIETNSFKILFASERLIKKNTHPEEIHGKSFLWSGAMAKLKDKVEKLVAKEFELAMCLYYPDGNFYAGYHSDLETSGINTILPSLSLGEVRTFSFREKGSQETYSLDLANGSLLVMGEYCQQRYEHSLPKDSKYKNSRINITFRDANYQ